MKKIVYLLLLILPLSTFAQTVTNVVAKQVGNTVEITYDLDQTCIVSLLMSSDGGATYSTELKSVTGDIGKVIAGHKKIVWHMLSEREDWEITEARFKVVIKKMNELTFSLKDYSFTMILVEGGTFTMGSTQEYDGHWTNCSFPAHEVTLSDYYIGRTEVTGLLWKIVMGYNQDRTRGDYHPVEHVSWLECQEFIHKLNTLLASQIGGMRFSLPTEAQWEYAAIGGHKRNSFPLLYSGSSDIGSVAWYSGNSPSYPNYPSIQLSSKVATKQPNELGIYDMSGNVYEWCADWYERYSSEPQIDPQGPPVGTDRVFRGGSYQSEAKSCANTSRGLNKEDFDALPTGFRLVLIHN